MSIRFSQMALTIAVLSFTTTTHADLAGYSQNFEGLDQSSLTALSDDQWNAFANILSPTGDYLNGYFVPAPNDPDNASFSLIVTEQGGPTQGLQQLSVFSDYLNNVAHDAGNLVNANVYQEQVIGQSDVGSIWRFGFDAKIAPDPFGVSGDSTAEAFIRVIDSSSFALLASPQIDMTMTSDLWGRFTLDILIDDDWVGQLLQFGFGNTATLYEPSAVIYDNVNFSRVVPVPGAILLLGSGLFALLGFRRDRN